MGSVPGTNSCPFADVVTVVPSQAAACDRYFVIKNGSIRKHFRYFLCYLFWNVSFFYAIFSLRFSSEKCPTFTVAFFRQTNELTLYVPLFVPYSLFPKLLST